MPGNWMDWLQGMNTGAPGGPMGPGQMPPPGGGMPPPPPGLGGPQGPGPMGGPPGLGGPMPQVPTSAMPPQAGVANPQVGPLRQAPTTPMMGQGGPNSDRRMTMDLYSALGDLQPEQARISRQRAMADQLRKGAAMPEMRMARGQPVAAHPLEFLSSLGSAAGSAYMGSQADKAQKDYDVNEGNVYKKFRERQGFGS